MRTTWAVVALVIAAAVQLVVTLAPDAYALLGPYFQPTPWIVLGALEAIVPFGLAAAVLVGADRWSAGRSRLRLAAGALACVGAADLVGDVWLNAITSTGELPEAYRILGPALFLLRTAAMVAAVGLLAAGLWAATRRTPEDDRGSSPPVGPDVVVIGALGAICVAATAWTGVTFVNVPLEFQVYAWVDTILLAATYGALAVLAIVALRVRPPSAATPELLIANGSTLAMLGSTVSWVLPSIFLGNWPDSFLTVTTATKIVDLAGFALVAAGFLVAGVGTRRVTSTQPA